MAFAARANPSFLVQAQAGGLAPGSYLWDPVLAMSGPLSMVVDLASQRAFVYRGGKLIGISTISSGKPGHETPDGTFTVLEKEKMHHSNKYEDAPMPYMERLTWDGLALHSGHPHGYPASHGCIRLPNGFAAALFKEQTRGMQVVITGRAPSRADVMLAAREKARATETGELQAAKFWQGSTNAPPEPAAGVVQAVASVAPDCAANDAAADADAADDGPDATDMSGGYAQPRNECNGEANRGRNGFDRSQGISPQKLSSPPR